MPETLTPPAPVQTSTPAPTPSPAPAPSQSHDSGGDGDDGLSDFAAALAGGSTPAEPKNIAVAQPKPADPKPAPKPAPAKPAAVDPKEPAKAQGGPKELREELERTRGELKTHAEKSSALERQIEDYKKKGFDTEALQARLDQRDKEFAEMQGELRMLKRENSPEFKKQYEEPFNNAATETEEMLKALFKVDGTPTDFAKDFAPIYQMAKVNIQNAKANARELFGDDGADEVMSSVKSLIRLERARDKAAAEERQGWQEKEKAEKGRQLQMEAQVKEINNKTYEDLANTVDDYRDPVDDAELAAERQKAKQVIEYKPQTFQEAALKKAHIEHRAAAFGPLKLQLARRDARIKELEEQLEGTKTRQPGAEPRKPGGEAVKPSEEPFEEGFGNALRGVR